LVGWATENDQKRNTVTDHLSEDGHNTFATYIHENYIKNLV